jgi:protein involved in polysaccharide export with SLBB domain
MRMARVAMLAFTMLPMVAHAQLIDSTAAPPATDTLNIGDRVRVRVAATRGNTNLFIGSVSAMSHDTLTLAIPGGKGTIILPRASISEIGVSDGRESHLRNIPYMAPMLVSTALTATLPMPDGPHTNGLRNRRYLLLAAEALLLGHVFSRTPPERWRPLYSWLDRP